MNNINIKVPSQKITFSPDDKAEILQRIEQSLSTGQVAQGQNVQELADFEDAVQIFCAVEQGLDAILTRDAKGFLSSAIPLLSIQELLQRLGR